MGKTRNIWIVVVMVLFVCAAVGPAAADTFLKYKRHTDAFKVMGQSQPEKNEETFTWLAPGKVRMDMADQKSSIVLLDKKVMVLLDHANKTYTEMPLDLDKILDQTVGQESGSAEGNAMAKKMMGLAKSMMKFKITVTETGETKTIGNWNARKYILNMDMTMGSSTSEIWASQDIKIDPMLYYSAANAAMAAMGDMQEMMKEIQKIKGISVLNVSKAKVMGTEVTTSEELLEAGEGNPPAGTYDIPAGYKKTK